MNHNNLIQLANTVESVDLTNYLGSLDTIAEHVVRSLPHLSAKSKEAEFDKYQELQLSLSHIFEVRDFLIKINNITEAK